MKDFDDLKKYMKVYEILSKCCEDIEYENNPFIYKKCYNEYIDSIVDKLREMLNKLEDKMIDMSGGKHE